MYEHTEIYLHFLSLIHLVAHRRAAHIHHSLIIAIQRHHIKMDFYRVRRWKLKRSLSTLVEVNQLILAVLEWALELLDLRPIVENRHLIAEVHITLTTSEIQVVRTLHSPYNRPVNISRKFEFKILFLSLLPSLAYSPHPTYGMVVQPDYANSYPGYGPNAYQCGSSYGGSLGPGVVYPVSSVPSPYSSTATSCYAMPPPQHLPSHDKLLSKDGWVVCLSSICNWRQKKK